MTPDRLRKILRVIGWKSPTLANAVGYHNSSVHSWTEGLYNIPAEVADWLETLYAFHLANPAPARGPRVYSKRGTGGEMTHREIVRAKQEARNA